MDIVKVFTSQTTFDIEQVKEILANNNIPCEIKQFGLTGAKSGSTVYGPGTEVFVSKDNFQKARDLITPIFGSISANGAATASQELADSAEEQGENSKTSFYEWINTHKKACVFAPVVFFIVACIVIILAFMV